MAVNCVTIPTLTTTTVVQSNRLSTTVTDVVSTGPPTLSTVTFRTCTPVATNVTCVPTATSSIETIPGIATTLQAPVTITVQVPITQIATLFGSSCTTTPGQVVTTPTSSSITTSTTSTTSQSISIFTPAPVLITSQSYSTMSDGSISTATLTSTSILPVSTIYSSPTATPSHSTNIAPIVGGAVGGFFLLSSLVLLSWYFVKRRGRIDDMFEKDDGYTNTSAPSRNATNASGVNPAPHTYHYRPVSHGLPNPAQTQGQAPLGGGNEMGALGRGNEMGALGRGNEMGALGHGNEIGFPGQAAVPGHHHSSSLTPLLAAGIGAGVAAQTAQLAVMASNTNSTASRPSSAGSAQPLVPPQSHQGFAPGQGYGQGQGYPTSQGQGYAPQNLPPGVGQNAGYAGQAQAYAPGHGYPQGGQGFSQGGQNFSQGGQGFAQGQGQGYPAGQGQGYTPSAGLSHNVSTGSASSAGTSWGGSSGAGGGAYNAPPLPNIIPVLGGAAGAAATRHRQQPSESSSSYNRSGSPIPIQDQRVLQIANAGPEQYPEASSSSTAYPSTADATMAYDGKGRPINLAGEKPALVHLDGGRYEEAQRVPAVPRPAGAAPPAYTN